MISPLVSDSLRGASMTSSTGTSRRPLGPTMEALAPAAISAGTLSAAGEPLHRLPPMVARPWTCVEPIRLAASTTPGHTALSLGCSLSSAPVTAAPTRKPPASSLISRSLGDALDVDQQRRLDHVGAHLHEQVGAARRARGPRPVQPRAARQPGRANRAPHNACRLDVLIGRLVKRTRMAYRLACRQPAGIALRPKKVLAPNHTWSR